MHPPGADVVVVRHGEIGTKSDQVRRRMESRLADSLSAMLETRGVPGTVERERNRLYVRTDAASVDAAAEAAADTIGVVSASSATSADPTMAAITDELARSATSVYDGGTYAVRARRAGESEDHPFSSRDLEEQGGSAVWAAAERAGVEPVVDLDDPDVTFYVECRDSEAFVFLEKREGPGGLPVGTQTPLVALVSGGIDSPVAAYEAMRRGSRIYPLYVDLGDYGGVDHRARAERTTARVLSADPAGESRLHVAPGGEAVDLLVAEMDELRMLGLRRFMYRVAELVAEDLGAAGVVSGEAIGQKSSQTTANLAVTDTATDLPIHRPLLTADKTDITARARELGTFEDATVAAGCNRVAPSFPETRATLDDTRAAEPDDLFDLAAAAAEAVRVVSIDDP